MAINYNKYINSTGTHYIANSGGDERGKITGGKAGDQTGKEWQLRSWYNRPWTHVFRYPDPRVRRLIAELGIEGALNDLIGYDQNQRTTFWAQLKVSGYRPANIKVKCEADCSAGVNSIVKAVGYLLNIEKLKSVNSTNSSRNTKAGLKAAGFQVLTESKYRTSGKYLLPGDVLLYENHHVAINVTRGKKAVGEVAESVDVGGVGQSSGSTTYKLGDRALMFGNYASDVKELQKALIALGYDCGATGADGDYGMNTEKAVRAFQTANGLNSTGVADLETIAAIKSCIASSGNVTAKPVTGPCVVIANCKECNIRTGPGTQYGSVGTARDGDVFSSPDTTGWLPIIYNGKVYWVSSKYAMEVK